LGDTYPELIALQDHIKSILTNEETLFSATISRALDALEHEFKVSTNIDAKLIPGSAVWSVS
jgi:alanyl-tRNA synthetase